MKIPLSKRLRACCNWVNPGDRVADVGCDHGYLSIYLLTNHIASSVIASDIHEKPLLSAVNNAEKFGVSQQIRFCLSDGVRNIPQDFDTLVCAGMGADVMISILSAAPWLRSPGYRLILQCQSRTQFLRKYLTENGWQIPRETVIQDGRFLYTVLEAIYAPGEPFTPGQCFLSPALLACDSPCREAYIRRITGNLERSLRGSGEQADPFRAAALSEIKEWNL